MKEQAKDFCAGRLTFRAEGDLWVASYSRLNEPEHVTTIGSIHLAMLTCEHHRQAFMLLMQAAFADMIVQVTGEAPEWRERSDHETVGHA
jgi:hypothetical protein